MAAAAVLVVDDDPDIRELLDQCLQEEGYTVYEAANGKRALQWLRSHPRRLVVLLDLLMPEMDGFAVLQAAAQDPSLLTKHAYIIISAHQWVPSADVAALIEQHQVPFLPKPFDLDDILAAVQKAATTLH